MSAGACILKQEPLKPEILYSGKNARFPVACQGQQSQPCPLLEPLGAFTPGGETNFVPSIQHPENFKLSFEKPRAGF